MNKFSISITIWYLFICLFVEAHSGKAQFHVIIDTDGAADDLRSICMILSNREIKTLAITTSEGALRPADAALKANALLYHFHHQGVPVGVGRSLHLPASMRRRQSEQIVWGDITDIPAPVQTAKELMTQEIETEEEMVIIFCFGPLTNVHDVLTEKPELKDRIERVIWYNSSANHLLDVNYKSDPVSADAILASGVRVDIVSGVGEHELMIDEQYVNMLSGVKNNRYAAKILETHAGNILKPMVELNQLKMENDLAVIYLFYPPLFTGNTINSSVKLYSIENSRMANFMKMLAIEILEGKPDNESRVFFGFPDNPDFYADDVAPVVQKIIALHGRSEWRAGALTNELHGHLGIYAIIGVKMGIRAREFFNIGVDDITVVTYAGLQPPVSCLNDGLQVSTGGTLGHGLISVADDENIRPEATFTFKNKTLRLQLKAEYALKIRQDVENAIQQYGNLTTPYWQKIRELAIKYWEEFDRNLIFEMSWR